MAAEEHNAYVQRLGAEIRNRRMARGMSLRALARELNLSGHGTLVDYEHGRRIPPEDLVVGCERVFQVSDGALRNLREKALAERADRKTEGLLRSSPPEPEPVEPLRPRQVKRWILIAGLVVVLAIAAAIGVWQWGSGGSAPVTTAAATSVRFGFEDGTQRWSPLWGNKRVTYQATSAVAFEGRQSLQITSTVASNDEDKAIGTTHGLETLRPGMKVTVHLRVPGQQPASIRFFAYDSQSHEHWAPESPGSGHEIPLPTGTDWQKYVWTVPQVDKVHAIGMEIYQSSDQPVTIWMDAVNW
jgi:transcriptional regulator with XRE-family HTH domain